MVVGEGTGACVGGSPSSPSLSRWKQGKNGDVVEPLQIPADVSFVGIARNWVRIGVTMINPGFLVQVGSVVDCAELIDICVCVRDFMSAWYISLYMRAASKWCSCGIHNIQLRDFQVGPVEACTEIIDICVGDFPFMCYISLSPYIRVVNKWRLFYIHHLQLRGESRTTRGCH